MAGDDKYRSIGTVISVSAEKLTVELHRRTDNFMIVGFEDMQYVAQLGSYILIPVQTEYAVCEIVNLREKDPTTSSPQDDAKNMNKAISAKFLDVVPVGSLPRKTKQGDEQKFNFGLATFPSLYADVLYATKDELDAIFEVAEKGDIEEGKRIWKSLPIGTSNVFGGYEVKIDIDAFFGGHAAVLGNTGSGKSCTVASILQSLFSKEEYEATGATFLILDVNGEYTQAFEAEQLQLPGSIKVKTLKLDGKADNNSFTLPHWFLSLEEWELLLLASEKAQKPVLERALTLAPKLSSNCGEKIKQHILAKHILSLYGDGGPIASKQRVRRIIHKHHSALKEIEGFFVPNFDDYGNKDNEVLFDEVLQGAIDENIEASLFSSHPFYIKPFDFAKLNEAIEFALLDEETHGNKQIRDYCSSLITRLYALETRDDFAFLRGNGAEITIYAKLLDVFGIKNVEGEEKIKESQITILDMSEVGDEVVELVSAVLSRMIFDLLKKQENRNKFPVHLVLEEAHRYVAQKPSQYAIDATQIFERIAKEGRKYGMFLMVASQRPSELSRTVLSQCANFIVHRIQNPDDLQYIRQMTPFISKNVLERLPSLPKQNALIFGNSVTLPTTFQVRDTYPLPKSDDAKIGESWFKPAKHEAKITFIEFI